MTGVQTCALPIWQYIQKVYKGNKLNESDVLVAKNNSYISVYENLISDLNNTDWVWSGTQMVPSFTKIKEDKKKQTILQYQSLINNGIKINDLTLAVQDNDRNAFVQLLTLLHTAESLLNTQEEKDAFLNSNQTIADINGKPHILTVSQLRSLLVQYGLTFQTNWSNYVNKLHNIDQAKTLTDLNNI